MAGGEIDKAFAAAQRDRGAASRRMDRHGCAFAWAARQGCGRDL
jgi:hypothetical protein